MHVNWSLEAENDLNDIADYIAADNPRAALNLVGMIKKRAEDIGWMPLIGREGRVKSTREMPVTSNYLLVYQVSNETVTIMRVLHGRRKYP